MSKTKEAKFRKYGSETYNNSEKRGKTNERKYGNVCSLHGKEQEKIVKDKWMDKYGVYHPLKSKTIQDKIKQSIFNNYGVECIFSLDSIQKTIREKISIKQDEMTRKTMETKNNWSDEKKKEVENKKLISIMRIRYEELISDDIVKIDMTFDDFIFAYINDMPIRWKCQKCQNCFVSDYEHFKYDNRNVYGRCPICFPHSQKDGISM